MLLFVSFLLNGGETIKYTTAVYNRIEDIWSIPNAEEEFNAGLSETVKYYEFIISELNGYATEIKALYNEKYAGINQIVEIHKLWYDETSVANSTINCLLFYSYQNENDAVNKTHFAIIPIDYERFDVNENVDAYFAIPAEASLTDVEYTYDNANVELTEYTNTPTFVLSTVELEPIMISNPAIRGQFDASYSQITGNAVIDIHTLWVENGVSMSEYSITYSSPIIKALVYLSYATQLYETREVEYDLQLNEWIITETDIRFNATNRTNGVDTAYTQIYINLPILPSFSPTYATSLPSLTNLKEQYANSFIPAISPGSLTLLKIWYRLDDIQEETVKCIVYLLITTVDAGFNINESYKTFIINYNNDTTAWIMPDVSVSANSSESDDKFNAILPVGETEADYLLFYSLPTGPFIQVSKDKILINNAQHVNLPIGSILMYRTQAITTGNAFLICDGSAHNTATYPELSAVLNFKYGGSAISGTFNVPNLLDRFPVGASNVADTSISTTDEYKNESTRTGGQWKIDPNQFVHNHPSVSHTHINSFSTRNGMDNESPTSNSQRGTTFVGTVKLTDTGGNHKPPWFVVKYIIYTGRGRIGD